jgi:aspartate/methionine/tyrosine aminotransferase
VDIRFSSRLSWPAPDNELAASRALMRAQGLPTLDFSESNPTLVGFDHPNLGCLLDPANSRYEPDPRGLVRAREALAADYASMRGSVSPQPDDLFLCASTSEAYGWLFKLLCDPGDAVLVPKPGYPLFDYLAGLEAVEARHYRLDYAHPRGWRVDIDSVRDALEAGRVRALVVINPNNPTGSYVRSDERGALVGLCARHGCAIIADEVFFGFPVEASAYGSGSTSSFVGEAGTLCFVLDGLSKRLGLPQIKLGWIAVSGPAALVQEAKGRLEILADAYLSAGTPVMNALPSLLAASGAFAGPCRGRLAANVATLHRILEQPGSPHRVLRCEGGWTAIVESPRLLSEEKLALGLLREEGIWSHPGYFFDMEREAFFTVGLILPPGLLERGARGYAAYFEKLQNSAL